MAEIALLNRRGQQIATALVDDEDMPEVSRYRWGLSTSGYAVRSEWKAGGTRAFLLHRQILGLTHGDRLQGDHINRDRLDCRRANLRVVTSEENRQNRGSYRGSTSQHRGVSWDAHRKCWRGQITVDGHMFRRRFKTEAEAAQYAASMRAIAMPFSEEAGA